ncbi:FKBP-type peptidyl-prolyl cis-trans isomerase [Actinomadura flavalba]|uniref:FKBP-type peptidyl-prolyl cis-trans isomerase n=1 Tax=Actinomadura flavalba TaxID=1120938 RepID=UPI000378BC71|nr:FKBP-type peptidyl-prolyl cis-trans isomerase [Actinomadura flavalba]
MSEDDKPRGEPPAKAKIPNAKNIRSPQFTPHGISAGRRGGSRPSGLTAAQAKKRQRLGILAAVVAVLAAAGGVAYVVTRPDPVIEVTGAFGKQPKISIPEEIAPTSKLRVTTPIKGDGSAIANGSTVFGRFAFYQWAPDTGSERDKKSTNKELGNTFKPNPQNPQSNQVQPLVIGKTGLKGVDAGLVGKTAGSRVVLEIPPSQGFGEQGEQMGLSPKDSVVFVIDVLNVFDDKSGPTGEPKNPGKDLPKVAAAEPGKAPKVTIPKTDAPEKLETHTVIAGTGKALAKNDQAVVRYQGQLWRNGKQFDSNYGSAPTVFPIGTGATVPGFDKGLTGQKVGSRVMLVLPPADGYGKDGNPQAAVPIKGDDVLVFIVDILGVV